LLFETFLTPIKEKEKERKSIYIAPSIYYVYLKALRHGSQFYLRIHHACLSFVSFHQMASPLTEVRDPIAAYYSSIDPEGMKG